MPSLLPPEYLLLALFLESIFWGINAVTLGFCLEALLRTQNRWKRGAEISKPMLFFAVLMGCVATFDTGTSFVLSLRTLAFHDGFLGPNLPVEDSSGWLGVMGTVDVIVQTVLGDSMLIYRCWIVYGRSWLAILVPVILTVAGLVCIGFTIFLEVTLPATSYLAGPYKRVLISTWVLTICINVTTTSLILLRIWRVDRQSADLQLSRKSTSSASPSSYQTARRIVIDSGLMHTTVATATAIVYICGSNGYAALTGIDVQMIAISFNLILIRVHQKRAAALRQCSDFERPPASTLRFGVLHRTSPSADTALGDLESNHNTRSFGVNSDGILDVSTSSN
ncbi:hypothetical protein C8J57DRAFT_1349556 [Mycena rebaudengoi]|nr:hypothetical protein C8J57DRAFT_1349556 [Mycena rebaudengoi]